MAFDARKYWDFDDPAASENRFRELLAQGNLNREEYLEAWAQIARTYSLRRDCPQCHAILDEGWEEAIAAGGRPKACFELERGRAFRSDKEVDKSIPFFQSATQSDADDLKVDAMHMLAIIAEPQESIRINQEALAIANQSGSAWANRWAGTLNNNLGWSLFDNENYAEALKAFQQALDSRLKFGPPSSIQIAKWCLARCHRAIGNLDEAIKIQTELLASGSDGYVYEELGETLLAQGKSDEAKPYFARAVFLLSDELGADSERIQRLSDLS